MKMAASTTASLDFLNEAYGNKIKINKKTISLQLGNGVTLTRPSSIAKNLQREIFDGLSLEERMSVEQWIDFSSEIRGLGEAGEREKIQVILKDLNNFVNDKVYFVGSSLTVADVFIYHSLFAIFEKLSFQEKEKLIHLSRWFNHIQNDQKARQNLSKVKFLRMLLYAGVGDH